MKYLIAVLVVLGIAACGNQEKGYPEDLAGKKILLKEKKSEYKALKTLMNKLEMEISDLDTTKREKTRRLVTTVPVEKMDFNHFVEVQGGIESEDMVMASSDMGGRLIQLTVDEGDYVKKGQQIGKTDMESVTKQIAELNKSLELASEIYERQNRLWKQNIGTEIQLLQAKNNKERIEKSLETVRFQLTKAAVYAPASGVVDKVHVKQGEMAGPGTPILQILNLRNVKAVVEVPEIYLKAIRRGKKVLVKIPALDIEQSGRISEVGRMINPTNRTFTVKVNLNNAKGNLKPNLLATMMINDYKEKDAVVMPLELIQQDVSGKSFVYVKEEGEEGPFAKKIFVETGESYEGKIVVSNGLTGEETIIEKGARSLSENELITVQEKEKTNG